MIKCQSQLGVDNSVPEWSRATICFSSLSIATSLGCFGMVNCRAIQSRLDAYLDGELPLDFLLDADCHLALCAGCSARVRFERAFHSWIKKAAKSDSAPSRALQRRIRRALIAERTCNWLPGLSVANGARTEGNRVKCHQAPHNQAPKNGPSYSDRPKQIGPTNWRINLPIAVVALAALCWGSKRHQKHCRQ